MGSGESSDSAGDRSSGPSGEQQKGLHHSRRECRPCLCTTPADSGSHLPLWWRWQRHKQETVTSLQRPHLKLCWSQARLACRSVTCGCFSFPAAGWQHGVQRRPYGPGSLRDALQGLSRSRRRVRGGLSGRLALGNQARLPGDCTAVTGSCQAPRVTWWVAGEDLSSRELGETRGLTLWGWVILGEYLQTPQSRS